MAIIAINNSINLSAPDLNAFPSLVKKAGLASTGLKPTAG